jgi:hypothetical protein
MAGYNHKRHGERLSLSTATVCLCIYSSTPVDIQVNISPVLESPSAAAAAASTSGARNLPQATTSKLHSARFTIISNITALPWS